MKKIWLAGVGGAVAGVLVSTQFAVPLLAQEADEQKSVYEELDLFGDIFERIRSSYVEPVEEPRLIRGAVRGMLAELDPHSSYLDPEAHQEMQIDTRGEFHGQCLGQGNQPGFGAGIGQVLAERPVSGDVAKVDNTPVPARGQVRRGMVTQARHCRQIYPHGPFPGFDVELVEAQGVERRGVIDEYVEPAQLVHTRRDDVWPLLLPC